MASIWTTWSTDCLKRKAGSKLRILGEGENHERREGVPYPLFPKAKLKKGTICRFNLQNTLLFQNHYGSILYQEVLYLIVGDSNA